MLKHIRNKHYSVYERLQEKVIQSVMLKNYSNDPRKIKVMERSNYGGYQ